MQGDDCTCVQYPPKQHANNADRCQSYIIQHTVRAIAKSAVLIHLSDKETSVAACCFLLPAMTNLCRDEVTAVLKDKIEAVFGGSFNTNGLGAVLTCGVTGIKAGLSHSPVCRVSLDHEVPAYINPGTDLSVTACA